MRTETVQITHYIEDLKLDVEIEGQVGWVMAGIGAYEFQGTPDFDEWPHAECQDFQLLDNDLTFDEALLANAYMNRRCDVIKRLLEEAFLEENR